VAATHVNPASTATYPQVSKPPPPQKSGDEQVPQVSWLPHPSPA
jgi:hypothetical protein